MTTEIFYVVRQSPDDHTACAGMYVRGIAEHGPRKGFPDRARAIEDARRFEVKENAIAFRDRLRELPRSPGKYTPIYEVVKITHTEEIIP